MELSISASGEWSANRLLIGRSGENDYREVTILPSEWGKEYPGATYALIYRRPDGVTYPVEVSASPGRITWRVQSADVAAPGYGGCLELRLMDGDTIGKTAMLACAVVSSLDASTPPPTPEPDWIGRVVDAAGTATESAGAAGESAARAEAAVESAESAIPRLQTVIDDADAIKGQLSAVVTDANTAKSNLETAITDANTAKANADAAISQLEAETAAANTAITNLDNARTNAETALSNLNTAISTAGTSKTNLESTITDAGTSKTNLESTITDAGTAKSQLQTVINSADTIKGELSTVISSASDTKTALDASIQTASGLNTSLTEQNSDAASKIVALNAALDDADEILTGVEDIKAYLGYIDEDIAGICVDYENKTFKRLAGAYDKTGGIDFDTFTMFGGRRRCNVADDGTIVAYCGDEDYAEDGSMGQVMVYQPKFYYKVVPLKVQAISNGIGQHLRKANYYVSTRAKTGFKLHPAFLDVNGNEVDYILLSAFEGSIWDASASAYITNDAQVMDVATDKFSSISGVKPASGLTQQLTRPNIEQMAQNRGAGWHGDLIKATSVNQLLMIVELGMMNTQAAIESGVVSITDNAAYNCSSLTGSTAALGNATGAASETINEIGGTETTYNTNGKRAITYRGMENPWGNIWKFVYGINFYGDGNMGGGQPFICSDFAFAESKNTGNYVGAGFTIANASGYISAMGYSEDFDWLFLPSECTGASNLPVGDYTYVTPNLNGYRIALLGGLWYTGGYAGGFYWYADYGVGTRYRALGGRLVYVPTATV